MRRLSTMLFLAIVLTFAGVPLAQAQSLSFLCGSTGLKSIFKGPCVDSSEDEEMRPFPPEPPEPITIEILFPVADAKFFFGESDDPEKLEFEAWAKVTPPRYEDEVEWTVDDIGSSGKTIEPGRGARVTVSFQGLPEDNGDFGEKTITASVRGQSDSRTLKVFFLSVHKTHPGEGAGETPNWYYYWSQTKAAQGRAPFLGYVSTLPVSTGATIGRYVATDDRLWLSDLVVQDDTCTDRKTYDSAIYPEDASGIDCFGEIVRHEWQHRVEEIAWWRGTSLIDKFARDPDRDTLPAFVEQAGPCSPAPNVRCGGCREGFMDPTARHTCNALPFNDGTDREVFAYYKGWTWPINSANTEDWSTCGKQWPCK